MSKSGAEQASAPQEARSEGEQYVDAAFIRSSEEYQSLLNDFRRVDSGKEDAIPLEQFDEMLDGVLELGDDLDEVPDAIQRRIDAARQLDKDIKAGTVEPETYAAKRKRSEVVANVEIDLETLDEADVQRARESRAYRFLFKRLEEAARGEGTAEGVQAEIEFTIDDAPTKGNKLREEMLAAVEQFQADLNGPLSELWRQALKEDIKHAAVEADDQKTDPGVHIDKKSRKKKQSKEPTPEQFRWFTGMNLNAQGIYRELLSEYRESVANEGAPNSEKLQAYQETLREKANNTNSLEEQSALETFANDLGRGVVDNIINTFDSEDALVESQMESAIAAAKERGGRGDVSDAVRRVAELNPDQMMQLYGAQKQLDEMGFFGKIFSKAGREAKKARKEFESLSTLIHEVERQEESDGGLVMESVEEPPQEPTFESLQSQWPQEVNSIMGALKAGEVSASEAVDALDELDEDAINAWIGALVGKQLGGIRSGNGKVIAGTVKIGRIRKDTHGTLRVHLKDDAGKRYNLTLATFLKQNVPVAEQGMSEAA